MGGIGTILRDVLGLALGSPATLPMLAMLMGGMGGRRGGGIPPWAMHGMMPFMRGQGRGFGGFQGGFLRPGYYPMRQGGWGFHGGGYHPGWGGWAPGQGGNQPMAFAGGGGGGGTPGAWAGGGGSSGGGGASSGWQGGNYVGTSGNGSPVDNPEPPSSTPANSPPSDLDSLPHSANVDLGHLNPAFSSRIGSFLADAKAQGINFRIVSGYRDINLQASLYNDMLAGRRGGPVARPGTSYHNYGNAVDIMAFDANGRPDPAGQQRLIAMVRNNPNYGIKAGADFGDNDHFEIAGGNARVGWTGSPYAGASKTASRPSAPASSPPAAAPVAAAPAADPAPAAPAAQPAIQPEDVNADVG